MSDTNTDTAGARTLGKRSLRVSICGLLLVGLLLVFLAVFGIYDISAPYRYRWQLVDRLESVSSREEMDAAVGRLGVVLDHPDGSWTAITYKDAHNFGHPSIAMVRTSEGRWWESRVHHCGLFKVYAQVRDDDNAYDMVSEIPDYWENQDPRIVLLRQIEHEPDPGVRDSLLDELGFQPVLAP